MNHHTNSYPLLERRKLQELQRALMFGHDVAAFGGFDNASDVFPRYGTDISSLCDVAAPYFVAARTRLAQCAVALALATSAMTTAGCNLTQRLPDPVQPGTSASYDAADVATAEDHELETSTEFTWSRSIYRARKAAKEYGS